MKLSLVSATFAAGLLALFLDHATADDYSCSAAKPCVNGACCGASGYCGYGMVAYLSLWFRMTDFSGR